MTYTNLKRRIETAYVDLVAWQRLHHPNLKRRIETFYAEEYYVAYNSENLKRRIETPNLVGPLKRWLTQLESQKKD